MIAHIDNVTLTTKRIIKLGATGAFTERRHHIIVQHISLPEAFRAVSEFTRRTRAAVASIRGGGAARATGAFFEGGSSNGFVVTRT